MRQSTGYENKDVKIPQRRILKQFFFFLILFHPKFYYILLCAFVCLQLFLVSLAFVYFSKAFCGAYMKSSITQIERRFDIPSSLIGVIDGSFEMGTCSCRLILYVSFSQYLEL